MLERGNLRKELEALLRPHGVAARNLKDVLDELHSPYRQFSVHLDGTLLGEFVSLFKQISHFAVFAHAEQVSERANSKFGAWEWVKHHARMCLDAPSEAPL